MYSTSLFLVAINHSDKSVYGPIAYIGDELSHNIYIPYIGCGGLGFAFYHILNVDVEENFFKWTEPIITVVTAIIFLRIIYNTR